LLNNTIKDINIKDKKNILFNKNTDIDDIMKRISQETNMTIDQIKKNRKKEQIKIKYLSIYILRTIMKFSCHEVSIYFEYKDHTTLSYACKIFELNYKETDEMKKILSLFT
jgi:chromosomal replication initiation ATPase DnaA